MKVKALIFDLDDTLLPSEQAYARALRVAGIQPTSAAFLTARRRVKGRLGVGQPASRNRVLYFKEYLTLTGKFSVDRLLTLSDRYERALVRILKSEWRRSRLSSLLSRLARRYALAVLTNENTRTQMQKLRVIDPKGKIFKVIVTSEEVGIEKPHPRIFREVFNRLRLPPSSCVMIGNDMVNDIGPMRRMGGHVFKVAGPADLWKLREFLT